MMKKSILLILCSLLTFSINAQSLIGAWEGFRTSENGEKLRNVVIFSEGYQVLTTYNAQTGEFIHTNGGTWKIDGNTVTEKREFNSDKPELVGTEVSFKIELTENTLSIVGSDMELKRLDDGSPGELSAAWLMSGRVRNGEMQARDTSGPRKTMKILSGTRFQWIAYNTETKQFSGTGGGSYTTINGEYTENIEFFSKDDSRVGASLKFDFKLIDGKWNHSGLSSKGDPIHEVWSVRK